jgi:hypothetical protein
MQFVPRHLEPVARPAPSMVSVLGDVGLETRLTVSVGAIGFMFERTKDGDWTGGEAITLGRGTELDAAWLTTAREMAIAALQREMAAANESADVGETIQCPECGKLLCSPKLDDATGARRGIDCGPAHVIRFEQGQQLVFNPDGTAVWEKS